MDADLTARVAAIFSGVLNVEVASDDADLFEAGLLDSLAFVELLLQLEREFGVTASVEDLELDNFRSIDRIAAFVSQSFARPPQVVLLRPPA
jgi:D-alanine--poly(phosphoribitol) ligase subunit 2